MATDKGIILILLELTILFSLMQFVSGDVILPDQKPVSWCYEISNIGQYPNYVFLYHEKRVGGHEIIKEGDCFSFYKNGKAKLYAIEKNKFNKSELDKKFFLENNSKLIDSNFTLNSFGAIDKDNPLEKIAVTLKILSLNKDNLKVQKSKVTYTYEDGTTEEKIFQKQDELPSPSKKHDSSSWFVKVWYIIIPAGALLLIIIILLLKRRSR